MNFIETICIEDNVAHNLEYHIARMRKNSIVELPDLSRLNGLSGRVKCRVVYNSKEVLLVEFLPYTLPKIRSLRVVWSDSIIYSSKYEDRGELAALYSKRGECDDIIICKGGDIGDSYFCNLVFKQGDKLFTPDTPLLLGTKRQSLVDSGVIIPCRITCDDILKYDGVYLINAMIGLSDGIFIRTSRIVLP